MRCRRAKGQRVATLAICSDLKVEDVVRIGESQGLHSRVSVSRFVRRDATALPTSQLTPRFRVSAERGDTVFPLHTTFLSAPAAGCIVLRDRIFPRSRL